MNTDQFWNLIESARTISSSCSGMAQRLKEYFVEMSADEIYGFQQELWQRLDESYRWDLWAVAFIIDGGCSDDGFEYFRGWLISQGRKYFEAALADPRQAAERAQPDAIYCEDILYVAGIAYKAKTGKHLTRSAGRTQKSPAGTLWEEDKVNDLYPDLAERFSGK